MTQETVTVLTGVPIETGNSFTVDYPDGRWASNFANDGHYIFPRALQATFGQEEDNGIDITFGASSVRITYRGLTTIPSGTFISCNLNLPDDGAEVAVEPDNILDFSTNTALLDGVPGVASAVISTARATTALASTAAGAWSQIPTNTPRITDLGLLVEPLAVNQIRNSSGSGAVAGTPGTTPTNSIFTASVNGITRQMFASGTANGLAYTKVRYSGTPSATFAISLLFESTTGVVAAQFEEWASRVFLSVEPGSTVDGCTFSIGFQELTAAGAVIGTGIVTNFVPTVGAPFGSESFTQQRTMINTTTGCVRTYGQVLVTTGVPMDITLYLHPLLTKTGCAMTAPVPTTSTTVSRNADVVTWPLTAPAAGGFIVSGVAPPGDGLATTVVAWNDGTANNEIRLIRDVARFFHLTVTAGGTPQCDLLLDDVDDLTVGEVSVAWTFDGRFSARVGNGLVVAATGTVPSGLNTIYLGSDAAGHGWSGYITRIATFGPQFRLSGTVETPSEWQEAGTVSWGPDEIEPATPETRCRESWNTGLRIDMNTQVLRFAFAGFWVDIEDVETDLGNDQTIEFAVNLLGAGSTTQIVQGTFSGHNVGTVPNGAAIYLSDPIYASQFGLARFTKGTLYRLQQKRTVPAGGYHPVNLSNTVIGDYAVAHGGALPSQVMSTLATMVTALPGMSGATPAQLPSAIICIPETSTNISVAYDTDSIGEGYGDATAGTPGETRGDVGGFAQRAFYALGYAQAKIKARGGTRAVQSRGNDTKRRQYFPYYTHALLERVTNDAAVALAGDVLRANRYAAQRFRKSSAGKIRHVAVTPCIVRVFGGGPYTTLASQTVATNFETGGNFRVAYNAMLAADTTGLFNQIVNTDAAIADAVALDKFKVAGGLARTQDGTHPNELGHTEMAATLQAAASSWT